MAQLQIIQRWRTPYGCKDDPATDVSVRLDGEATGRRLAYSFCWSVSCYSCHCSCRLMRKSEG